MINLKMMKFQRCIKLQDIRGVTKSTLLKQKEFVVHVRNQYDYRWRATEEKRDFVIKNLQSAFFTKTGRNLPIYGVLAEDLGYYCSTK